jgi:hypothetical protein
LVFRNKKNAKASLKEHAQSIDGFHNNARKCAFDLKIKGKVLNMCGMSQAQQKRRHISSFKNYVRHC